MNSVSVPVIDDKLAEGENETFDLMLIVPSSLSPAITVGGRDSAVGAIIDTTGEHIAKYSQCSGTYAHILEVKLICTFILLSRN